MEHIMEILMVMFCVFAGLVKSITVSSNGNSPEIKMIGGIMVEHQKRHIAVKPITQESRTQSQENRQQSERLLTKLGINERYRRLIPYMTFYYANDLTTPRSDNTKTLEVEKAEIVEANQFEESNKRQPKKIVNSPSRIIPRYQGNRLTQFNLASASPTQIFYKDGFSLYHNTNKVTPNFNTLLPEQILINNDYNTERFFSKPTAKPSVILFSSPSRKPYLNIYKPKETPNIRYYLPEKETSKYKLVPYEQTPPVKVVAQNNNMYENKKPDVVSVLVPREQVYIKPRPTRPQYFYESINVPSPYKNKPVIVTDEFYEKQELSGPLLFENGFKPILNPTFAYTTELPGYASTTSQTFVTNSDHQKQRVTGKTPEHSINENNENLYQYVAEQPTYKPAEYTNSDTINLAALLKSLQQNRSIPKPITRENVGSSIRTLLEALNALKSTPKEIYHQTTPLSTPETYVTPKNVIDVTYTTIDDKPIASSPGPNTEDSENIPDEPYLAPLKNPSQNLDDFQLGGGTIQHFPLPVTSDEEGGTPGHPGIDYPILTTIPQTAFDCKTQRYKGFFADPETRCQVWHYCDLNGGQASFLCPNGTIFSQAALTCDWWFNVRCASTAQLYVINESLYKYILPHSPKFPEDFSGPLVDKYLTLKFKEMEEEFKKNKNKQSNNEKIKSEDSSEDSNEKGSEVTKNVEHGEVSKLNTVREASVIVESPGASGNVERLHD